MSFPKPSQKRERERERERERLREKKFSKVWQKNVRLARTVLEKRRTR